MKRRGPEISLGRVARMTGSVLGGAGFVAALLFIGLMAGGVISARKDTTGVTLLFRNAAILSTLWLPEFSSGPFGVQWNPPRTPISEDGPVTRYDPDRSYAGVNLLVTAEGTEATLVSMQGEVLHSWSRPFDEVWPDPDHIPGYRPDLNFYWRRVHLYPNGDILAIYESPDLTPYGLGIARLDKDSKVVWKTPGGFHHDLAVGPDGLIYVLFQEISDKRYMNRVAFETPYLSEGVAVLDPNGGLLRKVLLLDALAGSDRLPMLSRLHLKSLDGDFTHMNTVQYIKPSLANRFPFAEPGQLLLSMREMNTIAILDLDSEEIVWSMSGLFHRQHEPQLLPNGNILIYDNLGHSSVEEGATRILEFDPLTQALEWDYAGTVDDPLESRFYGSQQRLPNGNTLIVESTNGRVLEVTPEKEIVWQFRVTAKRQHQGKTYLPAVTDMVRFPPDSLDFLDELAVPD